MEDSPEEEITDEASTKEVTPHAVVKFEKKILVTNQNIPNEAIALLRGSFEVHFLPYPGDERLFIRYSQCMDGILLDDPFLSLDLEFFRGAGLGLKVISVVGWTPDNINLKEATKRRIKIGVCPSDVALSSAAEVAVGVAIFLCRRMKEGNVCLLRGISDLANPMWLLGRSLADCSCAILGLGKLGLSIAMQLQHFYPKRIVYYSRRMKPVANKISIERVLFNELIEKSDIIFLCLPYNEVTRQMFDEDLIMKMKRGSFLINPSHAGLVNINDLYCALRKGILSGAAMDIDMKNAPSAKHPIHRLDNFIMLPNIGRSCAVVKLRMYMVAVQNLISGLTEKKMIHPYPPLAEGEVFTETEEQRLEREEREAELERLEAERKENLKLEKEKRITLEEIQRQMLIDQLKDLEEEKNNSLRDAEELKVDSKSNSS